MAPHRHYVFHIVVHPSRHRYRMQRVARVGLSSLPKQVLLSKLMRTRGPWFVYVSLIDKRRMRKLNHFYLGKHEATDVLSFSRLEGPRIASIQKQVGDILLCEDVAKKQSKLEGVSLSQVLDRLLIHGLLHLFGFDHERSKAEAARMFALQDKIYPRIDSMG